jgi:hypothetical protein
MKERLFEALVAADGADYGEFGSMAAGQRALTRWKCAKA